MPPWPRSPKSWASPMPRTSRASTCAPPAAAPARSAARRIAQVQWPAKDWVGWEAVVLRSSPFSPAGRKGGGGRRRRRLTEGPGCCPPPPRCLRQRGPPPRLCCAKTGRIGRTDFGAPPAIRSGPRARPVLHRAAVPHSVRLFPIVGFVARHKLHFASRTWMKLKKFRPPALRGRGLGATGSIAPPLPIHCPPRPRDLTGQTGYQRADRDCPGRPA